MMAHKQRDDDDGWVVLLTFLVLSSKSSTLTKNSNNLFVITLATLRTFEKLVSRRGMFASNALFRIASAIIW